MRSYQEVDFGTKVGFVCGFVALLMMIAGGGCSSEPDVKNRVPTVGYQLEQATRSAQDAKAAADRAEQTRKDIQASIDKLNSEGRNSDGSKKIGAPEKSNPGVVRDFTIGSPTFTFAQRDGFVKTFNPVCDGQVIPGYTVITLNFHWKEWSDSQHPGCYVIDSYTVGQ